MPKRTASFFTTYTTSVDVGPKTKVNEDTYSVVVDEGSEKVAIYTWNFYTLDSMYNTIIGEISSSTITKLQLGFRYNNNTDGAKLSLFKYRSEDDPSVQTGNNILEDISSTELATADILSTNQTGLTVILADEDNLYYESLLRIVDRGNITVAFKRHSDFDTSDGSVELSGRTIVGGTSEWRAAGANEPLGAPLLIITYDIATEAHPVLNMKFTTSDPTTNQNTPSNSLGKYIALNDVAPSSPIDESISSTQTTVPIDPNSALPTKLGLGSVGPEIFQYSIIDTANHQLSSVVRGIAPNAFPAGFDSFKNAENVYYLHKDATNDLHLLFDTRPASDLVQYRCITIANTDSDDDFNITEGVIGIAQNPNAKSQVVIGVELPKWDAVTGVTVDGTNNNTSSTLLVTDDTILRPNGFYDGAFLKITDPSSSVFYTVADSYVSDGSNGEFIIDPAVTGLVAGWNFVIMPAPAQQTPNDATAPSVISGRFGGFSEDVEGIPVNLLDHGAVMQENDLFYVWLKRTLTANTETESDTGAVLIFRYRDT